MINKIKGNFFLLISSLLIIYFGFNLLDGDRGLISFIKKKNSIILLKENKFDLIYNIKEIKLKNSFLSDRINLDFIEILLRDKFVLGKKDEKIYILKNE